MVIKKKLKRFSLLQATRFKENKLLLFKAGLNFPFEIKCLQKTESVYVSKLVKHSIRCN